MKLFLPLLFLFAGILPVSAATHCHTHHYLTGDVVHCHKIKRHVHLPTPAPRPAFAAASPFVSADSWNAALGRCIDEWNRKEVRK
jgi:hypothetical protein